MAKYSKPRSLFFPLLLVAAGVTIFLINIGSVEGSVWENLAMYWPVILILGGLDGLYKRDGWAGPLVLLGLGVVLLLGNLNYLSMGAFPLFLRLWPVLLVAVGLDIAFGHRDSVWNTILRIGLGVVLVGAIVWLAMSSPFGAGMKSIEIHQPLDDAVSSTIIIALPVGELELGGGADPTLLITGEVSLPRNMTFEPDYTAPRNGRSELQLDSKGVVTLPFNATLMPWDLQFNSLVPIDLVTSMGAGNLELDLASTGVVNLSTEMGVGRQVVRLPCEEDLTAKLTLAIGLLEVHIPKGCDITINAENGLVSTTLPETYSRTGDMIENRETGSSSGRLNLKTELAVGALVIKEVGN